MAFSHRRLNISIVGAGKVGTTLGSMLFRAHHRIVAVVSGSVQSARKCGRLVACWVCSDDCSVIPSTTDLIFIAVPDREIRNVAAAIAAVPHLEFDRMYVCHTSGAITSDELAPLATKGARVFSLHPIQTFPRRTSLADQRKSMREISYGFEGPKNTLPFAKRIVRQLRGDILVVPKEAKILYHLACVIASNYSVTLIGALESVAAQATGKKLSPYLKLLTTSIQNATKIGAVDALTGPVARGDAAVISRHLGAIQNPELRNLYRSLGAFALKLAAQKGTLTADQELQLQDLLKMKGSD